MYLNILHMLCKLFHMIFWIKKINKSKKRPNSKTISSIHGTFAFWNDLKIFAFNFWRKKTMLSSYTLSAVETILRRRMCYIVSKVANCAWYVRNWQKPCRADYKYMKNVNRRNNTISITIDLHNRLSCCKKNALFYSKNGTRTTTTDRWKWLSSHESVGWRVGVGFRLCTNHVLKEYHEFRKKIFNWCKSIRLIVKLELASPPVRNQLI